MATQETTMEKMVVIVSKVPPLIAASWSLSSWRIVSRPLRPGGGKIAYTADSFAAIGSPPLKFH